MEGVLRSRHPNPFGLREAWEAGSREPARRAGARIAIAVLCTVLGLLLVAPMQGETQVDASAAGGAAAGRGSIENALLAAAGAWSATWGGAWRTADGGLVLGFTDRPQATVERLLAGLGQPSVRVSGQLVRFSLAELTAVDQQMYDLATGRPGLRTVHTWSVSPERNRVVAYVQSPDSARSELAAAGVDVEKVDFAPPRGDLSYRQLACTRASCVDEPTRGGLSWYTSRGGCTTGFGATQGGAPGFISAGHCAGEGATAFLGRPPSGTEYGTVTSSVESAGVDGLFARRGPDFPNGSRGWIYVSASDPQHDITAETSGYVTGDTTCYSGMTSGYNCGTIADGSFTDAELGLRDVVLTDAAACGAAGDSGAPYFDGASTAQGVLSGDLLDQQGQCVNGIYTKLARVESAVGAQIILE